MTWFTGKLTLLGTVAFLAGCGSASGDDSAGSSSGGSHSGGSSVGGGETAPDDSGGDQGGEGNVGDHPDRSMQCESYCALVDKCPCFSEGACIENCLADCEQSFPSAKELGCEAENQNYLDCAIAITDECASGYIQDAINEQCTAQTIALLECKGG